MGLQILTIDCATPAVKILTAAQYRALVDLAAFERHARGKAAQTLWQARLRCREMRRRASDQLVTELALVREQFDSDTTSLRERAVGDAVIWLVDQLAVEDAAVSRVEAAVRSLIASVLKQFYSPSAMSTALAERVVSELPAALEQGRVRVRVNEHDVEAIRKVALEWPTLSWEEDSTLARGQAVMDTPYIQLRLDVSDQLLRVLERLRGAKRFEDPHGDLS
ncbi:FliH/SctL family protein [Paraburkholderia sediminicola]|uniref:hypothetical protein n=1 Tax=Paraburkholderia sediminicola TaxID=458836 RepID=UPI0038BA4942